MLTVNGTVSGRITSERTITGALSATQTMTGALSNVGRKKGEITISGDVRFTDPDDDGNIIVEVV